MAEEADNPRAAARNRPSSGEVTQLLDAARAGNLSARDRLLELVYQELRTIAASKMRGERADHTLGATGLVNESYLRLFRIAGQEAPLSFAHRHAFYQAAATAMQRILIDHARARGARKRGGSAARRISLDVLEAAAHADPSDLLSLDDALCRLQEEDERAAAVVRMRFFGGRQFEEIAQLNGVTVRTIKRDWEFARARLQQLMEAQDEQGADAAAT